MRGHYAIETGALLAGKYRVLGLLGEGGMGAVYKASHETLGREVAIKVLDPVLAAQADFMRRFQLEARAAATIGHPGIVDVLDTGESAGVQYIVMEFLEGITLRAFLTTYGPLSPGGAVAVALPVLDTLTAAHAAGVIHRDLKPANLFLVARPRPAVKVLDFGICKVSGDEHHTAAGSALGTPAYMAPEQLRGGRAPTPAADLYGVGAVLYTMLTGEPPFRAESDFALVGRVLTEAAPLLSRARPSLPPALERLVAQLLAKEPQQRPATTQAVRTALLEIAEPEPTAVWKPGRTFAAELTPARAAVTPSMSAHTAAVSAPRSAAAAAANATSTLPTPSRSSAPVPGVLYSHTLKAFLDRVVFRRGLLNPEFREGLKKLGIDPTRPRDVDFPTWLATVELTARSLAPGKPRAEAMFEVGQEMVRGYEASVVGKALFLTLRMMGTHRMVLQVAESFRTTDTIMKPTVRDLGPHAVEIDFVTTGGVPTYLQGVLVEAAAMTHARDFKVTFTERPDGSTTFKLSWA